MCSVLGKKTSYQIVGFDVTIDSKKGSIDNKSYQD